MTTALMIQGTGSHVGKSVLTAALCRIFREDGIAVAPFKPQNMALNSFVTEEGHEIGRAQAMQAEAAELKPHVDMNPILLKPESDKGSQVIIQGKVYGRMMAAEYHRFKGEAKRFVKESFDRLAAGYKLVVIEGAGSPAEVNLRENDIANMGTAKMVDAPVILVGDIDRGGVFAALVGTLELLEEGERKRVKGFIINKFRGDVSLLEPGLDFLEEKTGLPVLGVVPMFSGIYVEEEDGVALDNSVQEAATADNVDIVVIRLPRISNFTDFDPLATEESVNLRYINEGEPIGKTDVIILPGTKNTLADLRYLREAGYDEEIKGHLAGGGFLIGVCGGYQMLGESISDPQGAEEGGSMEGLGYLKIKTVMKEEKRTVQVEAAGTNKGALPFEAGSIKGYEIHMGESFYTGGTKPLFDVTSRNGEAAMTCDGAASVDGRTWGTYIHGIFDNDEFRTSFLQSVAKKKGINFGGKGTSSFLERKEEGFKKLADHVRCHVDMDKIYDIAGLSQDALS